MAAAPIAARAATGTPSSASIADEDPDQALGAADDRRAACLRRRRARGSAPTTAAVLRACSRRTTGAGPRSRGRRSRVPVPRVVVAHSGSSPTIERTRQRHPLPVGRWRGRRRRSRPPRPTSPCHVWRGRDVARSARRTWWRRPRTPRSCCGEHERDLQQVQRSTSPSTRCRRSALAGRPPASVADRSIGPMLSRPRKPPSNTLLPGAVLAVDPPGEVEQQLVEHPGQEVEVAASRRSRTPAARPMRAPAG